MWIIHLGTSVFNFQLLVHQTVKKLNQTSAIK